MNHPDPEIQNLQAEIFWSKVARARAMTIDEKIFAGPRLHDIVCQRMRDGIHHQHPEFTADEVEQELRRQLAIKRQLDERGFYRDAGVIDE